MTGNKKKLPVSKLPRLLPRVMTAVVNKKPTRLDIMKEEFHRQIMKEKENVIIENYERKRRNSYGTYVAKAKPTAPVVRKPTEAVFRKPTEAVFRKPTEAVFRKPTEAVFKKPTEPVFKKPIGVPLKKKPLGGEKKQESPVRQVNRDGSGGPRKTMAEIQAFYKRSYNQVNGRRSSVPNIEKNLMKRSAGKDRSNLLPPLHPNGNGGKIPAKRVAPIPPIAKNQQNDKIKSYSAPSGSKKPTQSHVNHEISSEGSDSPIDDEENSQPDSSCSKKLKHKNSLSSDNDGDGIERVPLLSDTIDTGNEGRRDSLGSNAGSNTGSNTDEKQVVGVQIEEIEGLSDFHKWKLEQMQIKEEKIYNKALKTMRLNGEEDEGLREEIQERLLEKQNELLAELAERQHELDKMQEQRLAKERREKEESEKRAAIDREKRAKLERERVRQDDEKKRIQDKKEADRQAREERERRARSLAEQEPDEEEEEESQLQNFLPKPPVNPRTNARRPPPRTYSPPESEARTYSPPAPKAKTFTPQAPAEEREEVEGPDVDYYRQAAEEAAQNDSQAFRLKECRICGRKFAEERLKKHEGACKTANKKRKIFDPVKMRLEGTDANQFHWKAKKSPPRKKNKWRSEHDSFMETIQHAKKVDLIKKKGGDIRQITPLPPKENPDYVKCPHCERTFNTSAAERHIPRCKDIKGKPLRKH